jgi:molybdopterin synthase catalytic subunit
MQSDKIKVKITDEELSHDEAVEFCKSDKAGSVLFFLGTTRDNFENKEVVTLSYECYKDMALSELYSLSEEAFNKFPDCLKIYISHRIGEVKIKEVSIVCAVSSVHRVESFECCKWLMDEIKAKVPIWKKEIFNDQSYIWKENKENYN